MFLTLFVSNEFSHNNHTHIRVELCSRVTFRSTLHRTLRTTNPGGALGVCVFTFPSRISRVTGPGGDLVVYTHRQYTTAATGGVSCRTCSKKLSVFAQVPPKVDIQNSTIFKKSRTILPHLLHTSNFHLQFLIPSSIPSQIYIKNGRSECFDRSAN